MRLSKRWMIAIGSGVAMAGLLGTGVYLEAGRIAALEEERVKLEGRIADGRGLLEKIPSVEREVIIQRATDETIRQILPSDEDVNNFVRTLQAFADASAVQIESIKDRNDTSDDKSDFRKVGYSLTFVADAFQLLAFLDQVESHARFMSVNGFRLSAARKDVGEGDDGGILRHSVNLDVETYVYAPQSAAAPVKIDAYDRKVSMLTNEIGRRRAAINVPVYDFRGPRGRRDPWLDPRVPVKAEAPLVTEPVEVQNRVVDELVARMQVLAESWAVIQSNESEIARIKAMALFEKDLAPLEADVLRLQESNMLTYQPANKKFENFVAKPLESLGQQLRERTGDPQVSMPLLEETRNTMRTALDSRKYESALSTFETVAERLGAVEQDRERGPLVREIRALEATARTVLDFEKIDLQINGVVLRDGQSSVALINGRPVEVGELLEGGLLVRAIREEEVEFVYRGVVLTREVSVGAKPRTNAREK